MSTHVTRPASSAKTAARLRDAFIDTRASRYSAAGFMLDDQDYAHLLIAHTHKTEASPHRDETTRKHQTLTLHEIQKIGQYFFNQMKSDDVIFSATREAVEREQSLGYVCYQMTRRLQRLEHEHFPDSKKIDYRKPFNESRMADIIRAVVKGQIDDNGFITVPEYNTIRAADIPRAMDHNTACVSKLAPYPAELMLDLA